jgi:capsular polysaccharide biosynthesis protein
MASTDHHASVSPLISPELTLAPPRLCGVGVMENVASHQLKGWSRVHWPAQPVRLLEIDNALLVGDGMVFEADGKVVPCTSAYYHSTLVTKATQQLAEHRRNALRLDQELLLGIRPGHTCYGHVLTEILGSLWAGSSLLAGRDVPMLVSSSTGLWQVFLEATRAAGISHRKLVNHHNLPSISVRKLYVVDGFTLTDEYLSPLLADYARTIRRHYGFGNIKPTRRLYVTRGAEDGRQVFNEGELWQLLRDKGFEMIRPESLSWPEQVRLFSEASHVVGPMGSALANAVFTPAGGKLFTLAPTGMMDTFFWRLAGCIGLEYDEMRCLDVESAFYRETRRYQDRDIVVNIELAYDWLRRNA